MPPMTLFQNYGKKFKLEQFCSTITRVFHQQRELIQYPSNVTGSFRLLPALTYLLANTFVYYLRTDCVTCTVARGRFLFRGVLSMFTRDSKTRETAEPGSHRPTAP